MTFTMYPVGAGPLAAASVIAEVNPEVAFPEVVRSVALRNPSFFDPATTLAVFARSPQLTEGPYFVDERLNRSNLTSSTTNVNVTTGVPLTLGIGIVSASTCTPLHGLQVDLWHCDAAGKYSDEPSEGTSGEPSFVDIRSPTRVGSSRSRRSSPGGTRAGRSTFT